MENAKTYNKRRTQHTDIQKNVLALRSDDASCHHQCIEAMYVDTKHRKTDKYVINCDIAAIQSWWSPEQCDIQNEINA